MASAFWTFRTRGHAFLYRRHHLERAYHVKVHSFEGKYYWYKHVSKSRWKAKTPSFWESCFSSTSLDGWWSPCSSKWTGQNRRCMRLICLGLLITCTSTGLNSNSRNGKETERKAGFSSPSPLLLRQLETIRVHALLRNARLRTDRKDQWQLIPDCSLGRLSALLLRVCFIFQPVYYTAVFSIERLDVSKSRRRKLKFGG